MPEDQSPFVDPSPFRCTAPNRVRSGFLSVGSFTTAVGIFFAPGGWSMLCPLPIALAILFLLAALEPNLFLMGVALLEDGFEFRAPLRAPKLIPFTSIQRIEAFCRGDGDRGDDVHFLVHTNAGKVFVREDVLYRSGLLKVLKSLPPFSQDAYRSALNYEPRGLDFLFGRRFTIYENMKA